MKATLRTCGRVCGEIYYVERVQLSVSGRQSILSERQAAEESQDNPNSVDWPFGAVTALICLFSCFISVLVAQFTLFDVETVLNISSIENPR